MEVFKKILTQTDIRKRLSIPARSLMHFTGFKGGRQAVNVKVQDKSHRLWTFRCSIRKRRYAKPVFSSGWLDFIRSKNLRLGDAVTLRMEPAGRAVTGTNYQIEVHRKIKLLGKEVWADVL